MSLGRQILGAVNGTVLCSLFFDFCRFDFSSSSEIYPKTIYCTIWIVGLLKYNQETNDCELRDGKKLTLYIWEKGKSTADLLVELYSVNIKSVCQKVDRPWSVYFSKVTCKVFFPDSGLDVQVGPFTTGQYIIIHGCIVVACILLTNLRVFPFAQLCVSASNKLHNNMFATMIKGIMRFFDTSSSGKWLFYLFILQNLHLFCDITITCYVTLAAIGKLILLCHLASLIIVKTHLRFKW